MTKCLFLYTLKAHLIRCRVSVPPSRSIKIWVIELSSNAPTQKRVHANDNWVYVLLARWQIVRMNQFLRSRLRVLQTDSRLFETCSKFAKTFSRIVRDVKTLLVLFEILLDEWQISPPWSNHWKASMNALFSFLFFLTFLLFSLPCFSSVPRDTCAILPLMAILNRGKCNKGGNNWLVKLVLSLFCRPTWHFLRANWLPPLIRLISYSSLYLMWAWGNRLDWGRYRSIRFWFQGSEGFLSVFW